MFNYRHTETSKIKYYPGGLTPEQAESKRKKWFQAYDMAGSILAALVIIFIIFTFFFRAVSVVGSSMVPTLSNGDWLLVSSKSEYERGDIIIITQPNDRNEPLVKRIVALGGETIDIDFDTHEVRVNGELLDEPYIFEPTELSYDVTFPYHVPEGCVFAMGDNRNDSLDSRSSRIGPIDERYILGKAFVRILPFDEIKVFNEDYFGEE